jgi:hypothetical protein
MIVSVDGNKEVNVEVASGISVDILVNEFVGEGVDVPIGVEVFFVNNCWPGPQLAKIIVNNIVAATKYLLLFFIIASNYFGALNWLINNAQ